MKTDACKLCRKPAEMAYAVELGKEIPIDGGCFGRWSPAELDALLGVKQEDNSGHAVRMPSPMSGGVLGAEVARADNTMRAVGLEDRTLQPSNQPPLTQLGSLSPGSGSLPGPDVPPASQEVTR